MKRTAVVAAVLLAVLGGLLYFRPWDPVEAARRRVPLRGTEGDVISALGEPPERWFGEVDAEEIPGGYMRFWWYGNDTLFVNFNAEGRAVRAYKVPQHDTTVLGRVRAWWPW